MCRAETNSRSFDTGCHEKSINSHEVNGLGAGCSGNGIGGSGSCPYATNAADGGENRGSPPPSGTTSESVATFDGGGDWQLVQTDFLDVPPGGDTSIRCVVQPPPDMLATHVCVEVGLVKSSALTPNERSDQPPEMPTIVVCSVDVEPSRTQQQQQLQMSVPEASDRCPATASGRIGNGSADDDDGSQWSEK